VRPLAFVGGTGPEGIGLALRFAAAGEEVLIGSRTPDRAAAAVARVRDAVPGARVTGCSNQEALAGSERVFLTVPFAGLPPFLDASAGTLDGKLVVDVIVPLALRAGVFQLLAVPGALSAGELIQTRLPAARVVSAFKNLSADRLRDLAVPLEGDVVLCGNDPAARAEVAALIARLPGLRAVDAGAIANARYVEAITALLLNLNRRYAATSSIRILGLPAGATGGHFQGS
jgi:8-hydroxy-5-deazaflavin:NADPH oxidoreductase